MIDTEALKRSFDFPSALAHDNETTGKTRTWCPFCQQGGGAYHNSPAFQIYKDSFSCFGCGASGDAINYIMIRDDVDFLDACKVLGWSGENISKTDFSELRAENERRQKEIKDQRAAELDKKLAEYSASEIWSAFQRRMEAEQVEWWENQGIPQEWQIYLRLGYTDEKIYRNKSGELQTSPAYTIPYFHEGFDFRSLQYRLCADGIPDRYRFEYGLKSTYYMVTPSETLYDQVVICEGAKKAIVSNVFSNFSKTSFLGVPSKTDFGGIVEAVKDCGAVYIVLDPDAWQKPANATSNWVPSPIKLGRMIGKAAKIVDLPAKVDDLFMEGSLTRKDFMWLLMNGKQVVR